MSFFKKLGETAKSTASTLGSKSAELVSSGKTMVEKKQLEGKVNDKLTELGSVYYQAFANDTAPDLDALLTLCGEIKELEQSIAEIDRKDNEEEPVQTQPQVSSGMQCPSCGTIVEKGKKFCVECGCNMQEQQSNACPNCNVEVGAGLKFCPECGVKLV